MIQTVEAIIDENGNVHLLEQVHIPSARRAGDNSGRRSSHCSP